MKYIEPEIEIILFDAQDIITTSGQGDGIPLPDDEL